AVALSTIAAVAGLFLMLVRTGSTLREPEYLEVALLLSLLPLLSPQGWDYALLTSMPAVLVLINEFTYLPIGLQLLSGTGLAVLALSVFDVMGRRAYAAFMSVSSITVCMLAILSSVVYIRFRRIA